MKARDVPPGPSALVVPEMPLVGRRARSPDSPRFAGAGPGRYSVSPFVAPAAPAIMSSPPPAARTRPWWRRPLLALGCLVVVAAGVVASYPVWADSFVQAAVVGRVERLTGGTLTMA